jgi:hypothetical protein
MKVGESAGERDGRNFKDDEGLGHTSVLLVTFVLGSFMAQEHNKFELAKKRFTR